MWDGSVRGISRVYGVGANLLWLGNQEKYVTSRRMALDSCWVMAAGDQQQLTAAFAGAQTEAGYMLYLAGRHGDPAEHEADVHHGSRRRAQQVNMTIA